MAKSNLYLIKMMLTPAGKISMMKTIFLLLIMWCYVSFVTPVNIGPQERQLGAVLHWYHVGVEQHGTLFADDIFKLISWNESP